LIQLILLLGLLYWVVQALPYIAGAIMVIYFAWCALGSWVDKPIDIAPGNEFPLIEAAPKAPDSIRFVPRYPDMPQGWNWAVHMYLIDEITVYELVTRDPYGRTDPTFR